MLVCVYDAGMSFACYHVAALKTLVDVVGTNSKYVSCMAFRSGRVSQYQNYQTKYFCE